MLKVLGLRCIIDLKVRYKAYTAVSTNTVELGLWQYHCCSRFRFNMFSSRFSSCSRFIAIHIKKIILLITQVSNFLLFECCIDFYK